MPGKCSFKEFWLTDEENKYSKWLRPVEDDQYKAYCTFCKSKFDISHSGLNGVKIHGKGKKHLELTSALLQVAGEVEPYLKIFQNDNPMLPFVHAELYSMARSIAARVLKREVIRNVKNSGQLLAIDVKNENLLSFSDVDIGFGAKKFCKNVKELDVQLFRKDCRHFLVEMFQKLIGPRSPLRKCMVKGASCLSPAVMTSGTLRVQRVNIALEQLTSNNHIAYIEAEHIRKNYLEICEQSSVQDELKTFDFNENRLDSFLFNILINAKACKALLSFCTMIFTMFHGNSAVERGFSVNKECLVENMKERSLISQRSIYSAVQSVGGIKNVEFTSGMLHAARRASSKRREAIEEMKKKESEEANRSKTTLETVNKLEAKKRKLLQQAEEEASALQTEIDLEKKRLRQIVYTPPKEFCGQKRSPKSHEFLFLQLSRHPVTWSLPLDNEYKPSGYKLYYRKPDGPQVGPILVGHDVTQYLLTRLDPQTWYEVMVLGISDKGDGEPGTQSILTLPLPGQQRVNSTGHLVGMLLPPSDLEAEPTSSTSINLTWTPATPGPLASYYTVSFSLVLGSSNASTDNYVRSTSHSVEINELKPHTLYEFKVRTHDQNNSHGPYSHSVECRTLEDVPGLITNVQWKPMNQTCVKVTWKYSNSDIKDYEVAVSSDPGLSVAEWRVVSVPAGRNSHELCDLSTNLHYFLKLRAITRTGEGHYTESLIITIPVGVAPVAPPLETGHHQGSLRGVVSASGALRGVLSVSGALRGVVSVSGALRGVVSVSGALRGVVSVSGALRGVLSVSGALRGVVSVSGLLIGLIVAVLCFCLLGVVVAYIWWRRCKLRQPSPEAHNTNGNGYYRDWERPRTEGHEMDYYCPSGATLDANLSSNDAHLDTKGGYPNGHANGLNYPLLSNGKVGALPQVVRDKTNVHITENPQYQQSSKLTSRSSEDCSHSQPLLPPSLNDRSEAEVTTSLEERNREVVLKSEEDLNATHDTSLGSTKHTLCR
uniref:Fibronectin type-III domain-containing protein n=1 Tax=Timema monikensis TaxID=170555 RepID=A0A7R9E5E8_9NEOP|nr:unnamed protein product [Timema monikensis]